MNPEGWLFTAQTGHTAAIKWEQLLIAIKPCCLLNALEVKCFYASFSRAPESFSRAIPTVLTCFLEYTAVPPFQETQPCDCHSSAQLHTGLLS